MLIDFGVGGVLLVDSDVHGVLLVVGCLHCGGRVLSLSLMHPLLQLSRLALFLEVSVM